VTRSTYRQEPARLHYRLGFAEQATKQWMSVCGAGRGRFVATTSDPTKVDCGRCLRFLRPRASPDKEQWCVVWNTPDGPALMSGADQPAVFDSERAATEEANRRWVTHAGGWPFVVVRLPAFARTPSQKGAAR